MKYFLILIITLSNFMSAVINPKKKTAIFPAISIDIGINGSCFDTQTKKVCEDAGLIKGGYDPSQNNTFISSEHRSEFFEHTCSKYKGECTKRKKYKRGPLASIHTGLFMDMNKYFALGTEVAAEWYRVKIDYDQDIFLCTNNNCECTETPHWGDHTVGSTDEENFKKLYCKDRFQTDRYYHVNANDCVKYYNKFQYSMMLALKFYLNTAAYLKVAAGLSVSHCKMPVYYSSIENRTHQYTRKNVFLKRGLACAAEFGFFITNNIAMYVRYGLTTNRSKNKILNYVTQNLGIGAQCIFGR